MTHKIKLNYEFQEPILKGEKTFEIRCNDRGFQKGDYVEFNVSEGRRSHKEPLDGKKFVITYVLNGWGLENGYVVFSFRPVEEEK